ncbi:MAG TPA: hypothetical protein VKK81_10800, partial [Candidatus Binatia bacterium]|nr:hypothetical protein [Candidatus Binatia bacterium]
SGTPFRVEGVCLRAVYTAHLSPQRSSAFFKDLSRCYTSTFTSNSRYRKMEKTTALSLGYFGKIYELSDPYPRRRLRIAAIREVGTDSESGGTVHYYEVEFDPEAGG